MRDLNQGKVGGPYPGGKRFAFTFLDDTDNAYIDNVKPVYDFLKKNGLHTTKTCWVYEPRGSYTGSSLQDKEYREWLLSISQSGFEIGLHNIGDGYFTREEIIEGVEYFRDLFGYYPRVHCNHESNPDNIYWWDNRFEWPLSALYRFAYRHKRGSAPPKGGENPSAPYYWSDIAKKHIDYVRNFTYNEIDTLSIDPLMPWYDRRKPDVNAWFSSADGHDADVMAGLLSKDHIDRLERDGGVCIVYTHFASRYLKQGRLDTRFVDAIDYLVSKGTGWFPTVSNLLDWLRNQRMQASKTDSPNGVTHVGRKYLWHLNAKWVQDRLAKMLLYGM